MHDRVVIIAGGAHEPVCFRHPIVICLPSRLNVLVVDRDILIPIPAGMLMEKPQNMPKFMYRHPIALSPPESGNVNFGPLPFFETYMTGIVAGIGLSGELHIFDFRGA